MCRSPHAFRWIDDLCYWLRLTASGTILEQSPRGFPTEDDARADLNWRLK